MFLQQSTALTNVSRGNTSTATPKHLLGELTMLFSVFLVIFIASYFVCGKTLKLLTSVYVITIVSHLN